MIAEEIKEVFSVDFDAGEWLVVDCLSAFRESTVG